MQGFGDQIQAVLSYGATSLSHYMIFLDQTWLACSFPAFFIHLLAHPPGGTPTWSEILNLTPKGDHLGVAQAFCDP